jgi:hypothetical protein
VPEDSALGRHDDPAMTLEFPAAHQWTAQGVGHLDLLSEVEVYETLRSWIRGLASPAG